MDDFTIMKKFFYEEVLPCGTDPCDGLENCKTLVNDCGLAPSRNNLIETVPAAVNYKFSADVYCDHSMPFTNTLGHDYDFLNIFHVSLETNLDPAGDGTFALWRYPREKNKLSFTFNDWSYGIQSTDYFCKDGEWTTYSVVLKQRNDNPNYLQYNVSIDGLTKNQGTFFYNPVTTGNLKVFVSDYWNEAGSAFFVRNFYYQTFAFINNDCVSIFDPCDGVGNCFNIVNDCEIVPSKNNFLTTVPAALSYKASAEVFCDHRAPISSAETAVLRLGTGRNYGAPSDRAFLILRAAVSNTLQFAINHPNVGAHQSYVDFVCTDGQWSTFTVEVSDVGNEHLHYAASIDGATVMSGYYPSSGSKTSGTLSAYVADNFYDPASAFKVRNFYYRIL